MKKIVINTCYGGFGLSKEAFEALGFEWDGYGYIGYGDKDIKRDDPRLVEVVERLGDAASGAFAQLTVREIPDDVEWEIEEYDGIEWVAEKHRTWH